MIMGGWGSGAAVSRVTASFCNKAAKLTGWDVIDIEFDRDIITISKRLSLTGV